MDELAYLRKPYRVTLNTYRAESFLYLSNDGRVTVAMLRESTKLLEAYFKKPAHSLVKSNLCVADLQNSVLSLSMTVNNHSDLFTGKDKERLYVL